MSLRQRIQKAQEALSPKDEIRLLWLEDGEEPPAPGPGERVENIVIKWDTSEAPQWQEGGKQE